MSQPLNLIDSVAIAAENYIEELSALSETRLSFPREHFTRARSLVTMLSELDTELSPESFQYAVLVAEMDVTLRKLEESHTSH